MNDDQKRIYFQLPETRVDCERLRMVCLQLSDGTELWFESHAAIQALGKKYVEALKRAEAAEAKLKSVAEFDTVDITTVRQLSDSAPQFCSSKWILYSTKHTESHPTLKEILEQGND